MLANVTIGKIMMTYLIVLNFTHLYFQSIYHLISLFDVIETYFPMQLPVE